MAELSDTIATGKLKFNEPMSKHTTWRVGGVAEHYFVPANINDLSEYLKSLKEDETIFWLGLGSNLLVRDGGIKGSVIATANALTGIEQLGEDVVEVGAGVPCAILARFCARNNLVKGEFFAGIPGVVGGALRMNAGAFGGETWNQIIEVETINRAGIRNWRAREDYDVSYRSVKGHDREWFTKARFKFQPGDGAQAASDIKQLLLKRSSTQPTGTANCGSVFKNPEKGYAAKLIEEAGLRNHRIGGAVVSDKHTNFIINDGSASAADIEELIHYVQDQVYKKSGIKLVPEVHIVGEKVND